MHLLLIGHGYLGHAIAHRFRNAGWQVTAVSLTGGGGALSGDVGDRHSLTELRAATSPPNIIIHCAASGRGGPDAYQRVYVSGCRNLLSVFPGVPLLFTSSSSVYAQTDGSVVTENSPTLPDRETAKLLLDAETATLASSGIVARLSGIYGPGRSVILKKFLAGEAVIEDDGCRFINQIHRDDAAAGILHLVSNMQAHRGEIYNLSDSSPLAQRACYEALCGMFHRPMPPTAPRDLTRKRGWSHKQVANAKLLATGWHPQFPSFLNAATNIAPTLDIHEP